MRSLTATVRLHIIWSSIVRLTTHAVTFTEEEKKRFEDVTKAREFRLALEQDMNVSGVI